MSTPLLSLDHVSIGYDGKPVLGDVHQTILPGARIGVLGENGAGKSTLLKCLVGELAPLSGSMIAGQHARVGYFAQHQLERLVAERPALATLRLARPDLREQECRDYLGTWGFSREKIERPVATLSGGEKARLVLALIAGERPALLVLDEPTNHLDLDMRDALAIALQDFDGALIMVAHDRSLLTRTVDEYWLVEGGRVSRLSAGLAGYAAAHSPAGGSTKKPALAADATGSTAASSATERRQAAAVRRQQEKPLKDELARLEADMDRLTAELAAIEGRLADTETYNNLPADELSELLRSAADLRRRREAAEERWLARSEQLEALRADPP